MGRELVPGDGGAQRAVSGRCGVGAGGVGSGVLGGRDWEQGTQEEEVGGWRAKLCGVCLFGLVLLAVVP